jgi:hypothetical protein
MEGQDRGGLLGSVCVSGLRDEADVRNRGQRLPAGEVQQPPS